MKNYINTVEAMIELFGENAFYNITFDEYGVRFQGKFHSAITKRCQKDGYKYSLDLNGFVRLENNEIIITLTE
jgi:hypothetical protein